MEYYTVQVKTNSEEAFLQLMRKALESGNPWKGRFLRPRREMTIRRRGLKEEKEVPLFPGYLFLETHEIPPDILRTIKGTPGFIRFLKSNTNIEPLRGEDREILLHILRYGESIRKSTVTFDRDQKVHILEGPLKGLEGKIIKVDRRKKRARVMLSLYENSFKIDFGFEVLDPQDNRNAETK